MILVDNSLFVVLGAMIYCMHSMISFERISEVKSKKVKIRSQAFFIELALVSQCFISG